MSDEAGRPAYADDWRKRWVQAPSGLALHRVAEMPDDWEADGLVPIGGPGRTACGVRARLHMPGFFSRMGAPRCRRCCRIVGVPCGDGAPANNMARNLTAQEQQA